MANNAASSNTSACICSSGRYGERSSIGRIHDTNPRIDYNTKYANGSCKMNDYDEYIERVLMGIMITSKDVYVQQRDLDEMAEPG